MLHKVCCSAWSCMFLLNVCFVTQLAASDCKWRRKWTVLCRLNFNEFRKTYSVDHLKMIIPCGSPITLLVYCFWPGNEDFPFPSCVLSHLFLAMCIWCSAFFGAGNLWPVSNLFIPIQRHKHECPIVAGAFCFKLFISYLWFNCRHQLLSAWRLFFFMRWVWFIRSQRFLESFHARRALLPSQPHGCWSGSLWFLFSFFLFLFVLRVFQGVLSAIRGSWCWFPACSLSTTSVFNHCHYTVLCSSVCQGFDRSRIRHSLMVFSLAAPVAAIITYFCLSQVRKGLDT